MATFINKKSLKAFARENKLVSDRLKETKNGNLFLEFEDKTLWLSTNLRDKYNAGEVTEADIAANAMTVEMPATEDYPESGYVCYIPAGKEIGKSFADLL